jgi:hypothetical protein
VVFYFLKNCFFFFYFWFLFLFLSRFDHLLNGQQKRFEEIDTHKEKIRELEKSQTESTEEHMRILNDVKNHYVT